jgi:hypothetical protein
MSRSFHPRKPKKPQPIRGKVSKSKVIETTILFYFEDSLILKIDNVLKEAVKNKFITNYYIDWYHDDCKENCSYTNYKYCKHKDHKACISGPPGPGYKSVINNIKNIILNAQKAKAI